MYVDARLGQAITVRGMSGADRLYVQGDRDGDGTANVSDGSYTPGSAATASSIDASGTLSGTIVAGGTTITIAEAFPTSLVIVDHVTNFVYKVPSTASTLLTTSVTLDSITYNKVTGSNAAVSYIPLYFTQVPNLIFDRNSTTVATNAITISALDAGITTLGLNLDAVSTNTITITASSIGVRLWIDDASLTSAVTYAIDSTLRRTATATTTISNYSVFTNGIEIDSGSGIDTFTIGTTTGDTTTLGALTINAGDGANVFTVRASDITSAAITSGTGIDTFTIGTTTGGATTIGAMTIDAGNGANVFTVQASDITSLAITGGTGIDTITVNSTTIESTAAESLAITAGDGADVITLSDVQTSTTGSIKILGGEGDNVVRVEETTAGTTNINSMTIDKRNRYRHDYHRLDHGWGPDHRVADDHCRRWRDHDYLPEDHGPAERHHVVGDH